MMWKEASDWTNPGSTESRSSYAFSYDNQGRLTQGVRYIGTSTTSSDTFTEKNLSYDRNGNILTLRRFGENASNPKDDFTYSYTGNRIRHLAGTGEYLYDGNGNMTKDALRNVVMTYDLNNQVKSVSRNDTLLSNYTYLADGTKYKVIDRNGNGRAYVGPFTLTIQTENTVKEYLENADAESGRIMEVRQQSGGSTTTSYTTLFLVKDHLGSVRAVTDSQGHVLERNSYYPFGLQTNQGESYPVLSGTITALYPNILSATSVKRDLYNGKEIQTVAGTDYLDYGFRQYDPVTARWMAVDPKAEKYLPLTPYNFCAGNPIRFIDFAGDSIVINDYGYIIHYQESDTDLRVFLNGAVIGSLGDVINADVWFINLLVNNVGKVHKIFPWTFISNVKENGKWDYKYRSPKNEDLSTNERHILGIAFYRKDKDPNRGKGDLNETYFTFDGEMGRAEDLNNFHFGVIGTACGINPIVLLYGAGLIEKQKHAKRYNEGTGISPLVPKEWRPMKKVNISGFSINVPMPPFGDNPKDFSWILRGIQFFNNNTRK